MDTRCQRRAGRPPRRHRPRGPSSGPGTGRRSLPSRPRLPPPRPPRRGTTPTASSGRPGSPRSRSRRQPVGPRREWAASEPAPVPAPDARRPHSRAASNSPSGLSGHRPRADRLSRGRCWLTGRRPGGRPGHRLDQAGRDLRDRDPVAVPCPSGPRSPDIEKLTGSRTLRQVIENLETLVNPSGVADPSANGQEGGRDPFDGARAGSGIGRFALQAGCRPSRRGPSATWPAPAPSSSWMTRPAWASASDRLGGRGYRAVRVVAGVEATAQARPVSSRPTSATPDAAVRLAGELHERHGRRSP